MTSINILKPIDVENSVRLALADYFNIHATPLPADYSLPCLSATASGGNSRSTIDTFMVILSARAETNAEALEYLTNALGVLEVQVSKQVYGLMNVSLNNLYSWGNDPVRPDLKMCSATLLITAHREAYAFPEE